MSFLLQVLPLVAIAAISGGVVGHLWQRRHVHRALDDLANTQLQIERLKQGHVRATARIASLEAQRHRLQLHLDKQLKSHAHLDRSFDALADRMARGSVRRFPAGLGAERLPPA